MDSSRATQSDSDPKTVGPYRLVDAIGQGGMGVVYSAVHHSSGEWVAIKMVRALSPKLLAALRDEVVALKQIRHPGVIQIIAEGLSAGLPWYAMELLRGATLEAFNRGVWHNEPTVSATGSIPPTAPTARVDTTLEGPPPPGGTGRPAGRATAPRPTLAAGRLAEVLDLYRNICSALGSIHRRGMVHRDLKPANVFLRQTLAPVVMDFGLVSRSEGGMGREALISHASARWAGSAHYMAPEQSRGAAVDARADLYALGCMLYETLCGRPPFVAATLEEVIAAHQAEPPLPLSVFVGGVPAAVEALLVRLLAKSPQERIGHAEDVDAILGELGGSKLRHYASPAEVDAVSHLYRPRFSGRTETVAEVDGHLARAAAGRGSFLLVGGESGIGKTFLATEIAQRAVANHFTAITGECLPVTSDGQSRRAFTIGPNAPLEPFRRLLQFVADRCHQNGPAYTAEVLGERGPILAHYEQALAFAPGQDRFPAPANMLLPAARRRVLHSLMDTMAKVCEDHPLLLVLDDLQWADELSLSFLAALTPDWLASKRLLIVGTFRSDEVAAPLAGLLASPAVVRLALERLDAGTIAHLVADMLGMTVAPPALASFVAEESEGNPFFAAEYLRVAASEKVLRRSAGAWEMAESHGPGARMLRQILPLPRSVREVVTRRLHGLDEAAQTAVVAAAVLGREMETSLLMEVLTASQLSEAAAQEAIEVLRRRQILEPAGLGRIRLVHDRLRETAYDGIDEERRRELHAKAVQALELRSVWAPDQAALHPQLAHHCARAELFTKSAGYYLSAARRSQRAYANADAVQFYRAAVDTLTRALERTERRDAVRAQLVTAQEELGELLSTIGSHSDAEAAHQAALALCPEDDSLTRARLTRRQGQIRTATARHQSAIQSYADAERILGADRRALQAAQPQVWWREWIEIQTARAWAYYWLGDIGSLSSVMVQLRTPVEELGSSAQRANFYQALCLTELRRERYRISAPTLRLIEGAARSLDLTSPTPEAASVRFIYAFALMFHGGVDEAAREMRLVVEAADRLGDPLLRVRAVTYLATIHRQRGELDQAHQLAAQTSDLPSVPGMLHYRGAAQANLGWVFYVLGALDQAERSLRAALHSWQNAPTRYPFQDLAIWPLAALLSESGRTEEAVTHLLMLLDESQRALPAPLESALRALAARPPGLPCDVGDLAPLLAAARAEHLY
jgi:serine/threonine protein kinase/tetratricopeptide (TPR) repeat protein